MHAACRQLVLQGHPTADHTHWLTWTICVQQWGKQAVQQQALCWALQHSISQQHAPHTAAPTHPHTCSDSSDAPAAASMATSCPSSDCWSAAICPLRLDTACFTCSSVLFTKLQGRQRGGRGNEADEGW